MHEGTKKAPSSSLVLNELAHSVSFHLPPSLSLSRHAFSSSTKFVKNKTRGLSSIFQP